MKNRHNFNYKMTIWLTGSVFGLQGLQGLLQPLQEGLQMLQQVNLKPNYLEE